MHWLQDRRQRAPVSRIDKTLGAIMLVRIRLYFQYPISSTSGLSLRERFWKEYWQLAGKIDETANSGEKLIREKFANNIKRLVQEGHDPPPEWAKKLEVRFVTIEYGSAEPILSILGVDSGIIQQTLVAALVRYSPMAFNESTDSSVAMTADVDLISLPAESARERGIKPLALLSSSLLVPVLLALVVLYFAFSALTEAQKQAHQENENAKDRALKLVEAQMEQNTRLSGSLAQTASSAMTLLKELHHQLIGKSQNAGLPGSSSVNSGSDTAPPERRGEVSCACPEACDEPLRRRPRSPPCSQKGGAADG
jgi:hypothetical protein